MSEYEKQAQHQQKKKFEGPKREAIVDLSKYLDGKIRVKLMGGRLVTGTLKGYDQLMNLVLDETVEYMRDEEDDTIILKEKTRKLGLVVIRGTMLLTLSPFSGTEILSNPYEPYDNEEGFLNRYVVADNSNY